MTPTEKKFYKILKIRIARNADTRHRTLARIAGCTPGTSYRVVKRLVAMGAVQVRRVGWENEYSLCKQN
jgi:DNA-binding MarR family transcriptional regulator